jgi:uncharacterized protein
MSTQITVKPRTRPLHESLGLTMTDGWSNLMIGLGDKNRDKRENMEFVQSATLSQGELSDLYRGEGLATKIIDIVAGDMLREGFSIDGDTDNHVVKYCDKLGLDAALEEGLKWSDLYGGSLVVMGIDDGTKVGKVLETPLREDAINKVDFFRVYERNQISWMDADIDNDPTSKNYGKPRLYTITPLTQSNSLPEFKVHYSRCLRFNGKPLPEREAIKLQGWGDSRLQSAYTRIRGFASSLIASENLIEEFTLGILTINNLQDLIAGGKEDTIIKRMNQIDMAKHIMNTILVDKDEDFRRLTAQVNGIKDILEFLKAVLSAVTGIPEVKLFGEQSKGLGSQASGSIRLYYDDVKKRQKDDLRPQLMRVLSLIIKSADFKSSTGANIKDTWTMKFNSLWQLSETEIATNRNLQSQADERYIKSGALTAEEVADSRFGSETYSFETKLDPKNKGKRALPAPKPVGGKNGGTPAAASASK